MNNADTIVVLAIVCALLLWAAIDTTKEMRDR